jgi:hypothetical protein
MILVNRDRCSPQYNGHYRMVVAEVIAQTTSHTVVTP